MQMPEEDPNRPFTFMDFKQHMEFLNCRFDKMDQRFDKMDQRFDKMDQRSDKIETDRRLREAVKKEAAIQMWKELDGGNYVGFVCRCLSIQTGDDGSWNTPQRIKVE
jgi:hypothetical protein